MPRTKDNRVVVGKKSRNREIRRYFYKRWGEGLRVEIVIAEIISRWCLSESTIMQIIKGQGHYKDDETIK
jgi:hypothetical protein